MATTGGRSVIVERIVARLVEARAKNKLEELLEQTKRTKALARDAFRVRGTSEEIEEAVTTAINDGHISIRELAALVDRIEENGAQHIFLFNLSEDGADAITAKALTGRFAPYPIDPTEDLYAQLPKTKRTYVKREGNVVVVKQIGTTEYWEADPDESSETPNKIVRVSVKREKRMVHLARFDLTTGAAEIRVDRLLHATTDARAIADFEGFADSLNPPLKWQEHLVPILISNGFNDIVRAKDETFMNVDEAADASVKQRFSSNRAETRGTDVRDHPDWNLDSDDYHRTGLNVYWRFGQGESQERIFTSMAAITVREMLLAKVFVSAKVEPEQLNHVLTRIRHFAR